MESSLRIVADHQLPRRDRSHLRWLAEALEQKARSLGHTIKVKLKGPVALKTAYPAKRLPLPITSFSQPTPGVA